MTSRCSVVIPLQESQPAPVHALQGQGHRRLRVPEPCDPVLHDFSARAADQDTRRPHPGQVLVPSEVKEAGLPRVELEQGQDLVGVLKLVGSGASRSAATGQQAGFDAEGVYRRVLEAHAKHEPHQADTVVAMRYRHLCLRDVPQTAVAGQGNAGRMQGLKLVLLRHLDVRAVARQGREPFQFGHGLAGRGFGQDRHAGRRHRRDHLRRCGLADRHEHELHSLPFQQFRQGVDHGQLPPVGIGLPLDRVPNLCTHHLEVFRHPTGNAQEEVGASASPDQPEANPVGHVQGLPGSFRPLRPPPVPAYGWPGCQSRSGRGGTKSSSGRRIRHWWKLDR